MTLGAKAKGHNFELQNPFPSKAHGFIFARNFHPDDVLITPNHSNHTTKDLKIRLVVFHVEWQMTVTFRL